MAEPFRPKDIDLNNPLQLHGSQAVAAVLLGLGPEVAKAIFSQMTEPEIRKIALAAKELRKAPPATVPSTLMVFVNAMEQVGSELAAGDDVLREAVTEALGADVAGRTFAGVLPPPPADEVLGPIAEADPEALAMVLGREQPQTIALILSSMTPEKAAKVMEKLPENSRAGIVRRMASVDAVAPDVLREVRQALTQELRSVVAEGMRRVDGRGAALEVLRRATSAVQTEMLAAIESDDPNLAAELRTKLFTFSDLARLSDRDIQALLKEIDLSNLTTALKGASQDIKTKFLNNMSTRASEMLADDLQAMGPVKLSAVEEAQEAISKTALELAEQQKITIVRSTDKML